MIMHPQTRHRKLLEILRVKRWYENLKVKSKLTADIYLRNFGLWLEWTGLNPDSVIELANGNLEEFRGKISDQIRKMEREGKQGSYIGVSLRPLMSYLKFYDVVVRLNGINIKDEERNLTVEMERIPTNEELDSILQRANLRQKAIIGLIAFSGLRPGAIGNYTGDDGLRIGDITDLKVESDGVKFEKIPALLEVRPELSKSKKKYRTFIGPQSAKYLREYLNQRMQEGEKLNPGSPVIRPDPNMSRIEEPKTFIMSSFVEREIKKAIVKAGFSWRPYVFRHRFGVSLDASEGKGLISHSWRMHIMGHVGDIETTYGTDKPLPDSVINDMREAFSKCLKNIETEVRGITDEDKLSLEKVLTGTVLQKIFGYSKEESEQLMNLSDEELQKELQRKLGNAMDPESVRKKAMQDYKEASKRKNRQVMIPMGYVDAYFEQGFEFVSAIGQDRAIMRLP